MAGIDVPQTDRVVMGGRHQLILADKADVTDEVGVAYQSCPLLIGRNDPH